MNKWILITIFFLIITVGATTLYLSPHKQIDIPVLSGDQIVVRDVVSGEPILGVTLNFTFADYCYPEDLLRANYDHSTCEGKYETIPPLVTNEQGVVEPNISLVKHPPKHAIRYYIENSPGYHPTRSYSLTHHDIVWLVPVDAPLANKEAAIEYLRKQGSVKEILDFYKTKNIQAEYLYAEKEAWYGVWRVTINLYGDVIRNRSVVALVHPNGSKYLICNPAYDRHQTTSEESYARMNEEFDFLSSLAESHEYEFGTEGCESDLLLN